MAEWRATHVEMRMDRFDEVKRKFPGYIEKVLSEAADDIANRADARGPAKIPARVKESSKGWLVEWGTKKYFYGPFIEFGTIFMPARPFVTPAVEAVFPGVKASLRSLEKLL